MNDARAHGEWFSNAVVSASNSSRVMARVQALVSGEGIRHPVTGAVFARGRKVSLGDDLEELFLQACAFEDTHGEDKGNGWLLRHPSGIRPVIGTMDPRRIAASALAPRAAQLMTHEDWYGLWTAARGRPLLKLTSDSHGAHDLPVTVDGLAREAIREQ